MQRRREPQQQRYPSNGLRLSFEHIVLILRRVWSGSAALLLFFTRAALVFGVHPPREADLDRHALSASSWGRLHESSATAHSHRHVAVSLFCDFVSRWRMAVSNVRLPAQSIHTCLVPSRRADAAALKWVVRRWGVAFRVPSTQRHRTYAPHNSSTASFLTIRPMFRRHRQSKSCFAVVGVTALTPM